MDRIPLRTDNPNKRTLQQICARLDKGEIAIVPTDSIYAIACKLSHKKSIDRILAVTGKKEKKTKMSLLCGDISSVSDYTMPIPNHVFKTMKRYTPGPYTFILSANNTTQRFFKNSKEEIGVRIPSSNILQGLHEFLDEPLICTSLNMFNEEERLFRNPDDIVDVFEHHVDMLLDGGIGTDTESTVLDCTTAEIELIRQGIGEVD
jgi:tRNA threonylcarbamoyl adenosine modification protein (Sua5/YciO/YrdC/YwlC family)